MSTKKMGFWAVFSIVFGSQIGSGIFMLPSILAPYGMFGIYGWCFAGAGAVLLALVFSELCSRYPQTGGPHAYVKEVFGTIPAFFIGWAYWLVSWVSTSVVIVSAVAYLSPFFGDLSSNSNLSLILEITLLLILTLVNCGSVKLSGEIEFALTILKLIPFVIAPIALFQHFEPSYIVTSEKMLGVSSPKLICMATVLCFWGFVGLECATAPAGAVQKPEKNIPKAIILGTCSVAIIYLINSAAVMGVVPSEILAESAAPFVDAINIVAGKNMSLLLSAVASVVCIGTLNAWILASAQISLGLAESKLLPKVFAIKNDNGSPYASVLVSSLGLIPILILTKHESFSKQIGCIIDFSVIVFLIVYIVCCMAYLKIMISERRIVKSLIGFIATVYCALIIADSSVNAILWTSFFFLSGCFIFPFLPLLHASE